MAQNFDNAGFAHVQAFVLNLSPTMRQIKTDSMRSDLDAWVSQNFALSANQLEHLADLSPAFKQQITDAVAAS